MVRTEFWKNLVVMEEMSPEDKYFYLYLLTNPQTTQTGIYRITKKQMAFDLGYSIEEEKAIQFYTQTFQKAPLNCHEYPLEFELTRGNDERI